MLRLPVEPLRCGSTTLRGWRADDVDAAFLVAGWSDAEVSRWSPVPANPSVRMARDWLRSASVDRPGRRALDLVIVDSETGDPLGEVGASQIDPERGSGLVGWWLIESARGEGHASRAVDRFASWLFGTGTLHRLAAIIANDNVASLAVARRAGFEHGADLPDGRLVFERRRGSARVRDRP